MARTTRAREIAGTIAADCVGARLRMLNRKISRIYDEAVRSHGIKFSQMNILTIVSLREPIAPVQIGRLLELEKSTLSRNLTLLESNGWIQILPGQGNGQLLRSTKSGRQLLCDAAPDWNEAQSRVASMLGETAVRQIRRAADRVAREHD